jgi:hypothetical protein
MRVKESASTKRCKTPAPPAPSRKTLKINDEDRAEGASSLDGGEGSARFAAGLRAAPPSPGGADSGRSPTIDGGCDLERDAAMP